MVWHGFEPDNDTSRYYTKQNIIFTCKTLVSHAYTCDCHNTNFDRIVVGKMKAWPNDMANQPFRVLQGRSREREPKKMYAAETVFEYLLKMKLLDREGREALSIPYAASTPAPTVLPFAA